VGPDCQAALFNDTFTNYFEPQVGLAALEVLRVAGVSTGVAPNGCCGRAQISKGLLRDATRLATRNTEILYPHAAAGHAIVFLEPSCLSAVREDAPALLRGGARRRADMVANAAVLFEEFVDSLAPRLDLMAGPQSILLHGHCHQTSMDLVSSSRSLLSRIPGAVVVDLSAGCCGMAGSWGYAREHYDLSRAIGERKLFPAVRARLPGTVIAAAGTSCRHQLWDFTGVEAVHPAVLLQSLLKKAGTV
jgi:Fe-S oxidoreductase